MMHRDVNQSKHLWIVCLLVGVLLGLIVQNRANVLARFGLTPDGVLDAVVTVAMGSFIAVYLQRVASKDARRSERVRRILDETEDLVDDLYKRFDTECQGEQYPSIDRDAKQKLKRLDDNVGRLGARLTTEHLDILNTIRGSIEDLKVSWENPSGPEGSMSPTEALEVYRYHSDLIKEATDTLLVSFE